MIMKPAIVVGLASALALGAMTPSEARNRAWVGAGAGFVAGALIGGAVANANRNYYYGDPGYAYAPNYAPAEPYYAPAEPYYAPSAQYYAPAPAYADPNYGTYGYAPGPVYVGPRSYNSNNLRERQLKGMD